MSSWTNVDRQPPLQAVLSEKKSQMRIELIYSMIQMLDNFISGVTIGLFNFILKLNQVQLLCELKNNQASRVQYECLVALTNSQDA